MIATLGLRARHCLAQDSPSPSEHQLISMSTRISSILSDKPSSCVILPQGDLPAVHGLISLLTSEVRLCFVAWGEGDVGLGVLSKTTLPLLPTSMQCDFANLCEAQKALSSSVLASCTSLRSTLTSATMEYQTSLCSSLSSVIDVHLASLVRDFCGPLLSQHSSSSLLDWLFKSSVLSSSLHGTSLAHLSSSDLQEELLQDSLILVIDCIC